MMEGAVLSTVWTQAECDNEDSEWLGPWWKQKFEEQEALLLQRDRERHLSVEILQLQNISLENPIIWHYLRDSTFSRFDTIPECDRHTQREMDRHKDDGIYRT